MITKLLDRNMAL